MFPSTWTVSVLAVWACSVCVSAKYTAVINVTAGALRGVKTNGYYSYLGIPYGIVENRFQAPVPVTSWSGTLDATDGNVQCKQKNALFTAKTYTLWQFSAQAFPEVIGSDDCLRLNVYTNANPTETQTTLRPVMVFIHGGGFMYGSGATALYGPGFLLEKDVVVVTFNYRLDVLGFMCLGIKEAPGNAAMKDQVLALKWVQENIKVFGGDPDNVTIFGDIAGAGSVGLHLVSPMSKGLFHKALMQSGAPLAVWAIQYEPLKVASRLATLIGYNSTDPLELYNIFMNQSVEELQALQIPRGEGGLFANQLVFLPCVENDIPGVDPFLTDLPYNIIVNDLYTKVPILIGYDSKEYYSLMALENSTTIEGINAHFRNTLFDDLTFPSEDVACAIANEAKELYFGNATINSANLVDYGSDLVIVYNIYATVDLFHKSSNESIYVYEFAHNGTRNLGKQRAGFGDTCGAGFFDDIYYVFNPVFLSLSTATAEDLEVIDNTVTMWTNFAKYGNPTPSCSSLTPWPPVDQSEPITDATLLVIANELTTKPMMWDSARLAFWNNTYAEYRRTAAQAWSTYSCLAS